MIFTNRNGLRWRDAPKEYGPTKTLYARWKRWSDNGVFARIMVALTTKHETIMIDATYLKTRRTASSLGGKKGGCWRQMGRSRGGMNAKMHAVSDAKGRPIGFFMSAGEVSDYTGAVALLGSLPKTGWLPADRGYEADWFRDALKDKGTKVCIPGRTSRKKAVKYDKRRYKSRNRIEIMFGRLKDFRSTVSNGCRPSCAGRRRPVHRASVSRYD